ncbi:hypothetical protein CERSUDRAFT_96920 [Gelatoporia subvermispora B]|uniref:F-box domain-containing protein n=1 Tax=Ceriporiopsis subvermispora (strain B) TaxID=914234 RepID=M2R8I4_CERS8|nr:hypothetical protein CERSUDRAFT_96920 [Gelatoporia subvermispora B]
MLGHPIVPSELTDRIIDFLYNDKSSLKACSLTCRTWLPSSRFHKFRSIEIQPHDLPRFEEILQAIPQIGPYFRHIKVEFCEAEHIDCFDSIARGLANLRTLDIALEIRYDAREDHESLLKVASVESVTQLSLCCECSYHDADHIAEILGWFPNLQDLRLEDVESYDDPARMHFQKLAETIARMPLRRLEVERGAWIISSCMAMRPPTALRTLQMYFRNADEILTMPNLWPALRGSSLEELTINIEENYRDPFDDDPRCHEALRNCPSVSILRFLVTIDFVMDAIEMLSLITTDTVIEELQLSLTCSDDIDLGDDNHVDLVRALENLAQLLKTQHTTFRKVCITLGCTVCERELHAVCPAVKKTILDTFGLLLERNVTVIFRDHARPR